MKKIALIFTLLTVAGNMLFAQEKEKDYTEAYNLIEVWLEAQKDFEKLPGLSAAIVKDQEILWSGAVGQANMEGNVESTNETICSICSISKLFTSVAIMKLYDQGKLRLDDLVADHLPQYDLEQQFPDSGPITIRTLLTHSSGLPREALAPYWTGPDFPFPTKKEIDKNLENQETLYPASTYFQYSNLGMTLLGEIVEEISGMTYDDYVKTNILDPLALSDTRTELPEDMYGKELAIGYSAMTRAGNREKVNMFQARGIAPAAGFSSTVLDLGKFAAWQFRLRDTTTSEILKPSTLKFMHNVHYTDPNWRTTWGLGFRVYKGSNGSTWVGHGGSCPGYRSGLELDLKNKMAYTVMINASGTSPGKYINGIKAILDKAENKEEDLKVPDLSEYAGYYSVQPWWGEEYITTWGDKLVTLGLPSNNPEDGMTLYKHIEGDTFRRIRSDDELGETMTFIRDKKGNITHYVSHDNHYRKMSKK